MRECGDPVTVALAELRRVDPGAAATAEVAFASLARDGGMEQVDLLGLCDFLWYRLPVTWSGGVADQAAVAGALGRLFDAAGLSRYARVCAGETTRQVLGAYALGRERGMAPHPTPIRPPAVGGPGNRS